MSTKRETVLITNQGKPLAKLVPTDCEPDELFGFFRGKGTITGDLVSPALSNPALSKREWGNVG